MVENWNNQSCRNASPSGQSKTFLQLWPQSLTLPTATMTIRVAGYRRRKYSEKQHLYASPPPSSSFFCSEWFWSFKTGFNIIFLFTEQLCTKLFVIELSNLFLDIETKEFASLAHSLGHTGFPPPSFRFIKAVDYNFERWNIWISFFARKESSWAIIKQHFSFNMDPTNFFSFQQREFEGD